MKSEVIKYSVILYLERFPTAILYSESVVLT